MVNAHCGRRAGITKTDVVVVLVIVLTGIGVLFALLPRVHEGSHHVVCSNNLKIAGTAIHLYHAKEKALPASRIDAAYATWAVQISPFLYERQENPLKASDLTVTYYDQAAPVRQVAVPEYFCPARRRTERNSISGDVPATGKPNNEHHPGALGDYGCAWGTGKAANPWDNASANGALIPAEVLQRDGSRILRWRSLTALKMLEDARGLSATILVGEKQVAVDDFGQARLGDGSLYNGDYPASFARLGGAGYPLAKNPFERSHANFGSDHPGICHFLMADGHVKTLAPTIPEDTLGRLINREKEPQKP